MTMYKFTVEGVEYEVEDINIEKEELWRIEENVSYRPDREGMILEAFKKKFPTIEVKDAAQISALVSRSKVVSDWVANFNLGYVDTVKIPKAFQEYIEPKEYKRALGNIEKLNAAQKKFSEDVAKASVIYKEAQKKALGELTKTKEKVELNNIEKVLTMPTNLLPISLGLAVENYTPKDDEPTAPTQKAYSREIFINYQIALLNLCREKKDDPSFNIETVITENSLK